MTRQTTGRVRNELSQVTDRRWASLAVPMIVLLLIVSVFDSTALTQNPSQERAERFRKMSSDAEAKGLAEPFKGITTNEQVVPGLFGIHSTGVSTEDYVRS